MRQMQRCIMCSLSSPSLPHHSYDVCPQQSYGESSRCCMLSVRYLCCLTTCWGVGSQAAPPPIYSRGLILPLNWVNRFLFHRKGSAITSWLLYLLNLVRISPDTPPDCQLSHSPSLLPKPFLSPQTSSAANMSFDTYFIIFLANVLTQTKLYRVMCMYTHAHVIRIHKQGWKWMESTATR